MVTNFFFILNFDFDIFLLERVIRIEFSQLERMYYNRVWQECRDDFKREFEYLWQKHQQKQNCKSIFDEFRQISIEFN